MVLMAAGISASRRGAATVVWRRVAEQRPTRSDCSRERGCDDLKSDSNKSSVVCNAGECGLRGGKVSGEGGGWWWCWRRPQIMQLLLIHQGGLQTRRTITHAVVAGLAR